MKSSFSTRRGAVSLGSRVALRASPSLPGNDMSCGAHTITGSGAVYTNSFTKAHPPSPALPSTLVPFRRARLRRTSQLASESVSNAAWAYVPAVFETTSYSPANPPSPALLAAFGPSRKTWLRRTCQLNQYVNVTKGANPTVTLGYDQNGNLTGDGTWAYVVACPRARRSRDPKDAENRLKSATSAGMAANYDYDHLKKGDRIPISGIISDVDRDKFSLICHGPANGRIALLSASPTAPHSARRYKVRTGETRRRKVFSGQDARGPGITPEGFVPFLPYRRRTR